MKKSANELYISSQHKEAIAIYTEALDLCPLCFEEDRAILLSNRAAAKIKLVSVWINLGKNMFSWSIFHLEK